MPATADIITIGTEILYGQTQDTNSHWISGELDKFGIQVLRITSVADNKEVILAILKEAASRSDIILITGGLGPTNDDLTKPTLVEYFSTQLTHHPKTLKHIQNLFSKARREMTDLDMQQAYLPKNCTPITNAYGTAPGMWFEEGEKLFVSMPGVPRQMKQMMTDSILPKLKEKVNDEIIFHKIIRTVGIRESILAKKIKEWENTLPEDITLAYLPTMSMVKLRLTAKGSNRVQVKRRVTEEAEKILPLIEKYVYGYDDDELPEMVGRILKSKEKKLATAESCTGGYLSHLITSVQGSSEWFQGGIVSYANLLKREQLHVSKRILREHGAVSEQVVLTMAENVRKFLHVDVGISISGIAGPDGGSEKNPVGTVWIGFSDEKKTTAQKFHFNNDRITNIKYSAIAALNMIRMNA